MQINYNNKNILLKIIMKNESLKKLDTKPEFNPSHLFPQHLDPEETI